MGRFMESFHLLMHANWGASPPAPLPSDGRGWPHGRLMGVFRFPLSAFQSEPPDVGCYQMGRFMESFHLLMHANWGHEPTRKRALTPSPSPTRRGGAFGVARVRWERVAA